MTRPSVYEFAGGEAAFLTLAAVHHERCQEDPVLSYSPDGFEVPAGLPVPHWSWDGLQRLGA